MLTALLPLLGQIFGPVLQHFFPNPEDELKRQQMLNELQLAVINQSGDIEKAAADIIKTEAASGGWLTRSWRPITMLTFTALIVTRWLGYSAPGLSEAEVLELWSIVKLGLGGYVIGRSVEKAAPAILQAVNSARQ